MFKRCPSCKRFFQAEEIKREQVGNPYEVQEPGYGRYGAGYKVERIENFKVTYKCKSCGHEWNSIDEKVLHDHLHF